MIIENEKQIVVLDMGGVLVDLGRPAEALGLPETEEEFWNRWIGSKSVCNYELGSISTGEFCRQFARELDLDEEEFEVCFKSWILRPYQGVERFLVSLRRHCRIVLLSNTNEHHWNQVRQLTNAFCLFDKCFVSFETGQYKPDRSAFEAISKYFNTSLNEMLFFDDSEINVNAARNMGMKSDRVLGLEQLQSRIASIGLMPVNG